MPTAPAPATAATSSGVVTPPIGACWSGTLAPSSSVNGVVSMAGSASRPGQRGVAQQQALAAQAGEVDLGHGPFALTGDGGHDALAPLAVDDLVAGPEPQVEGAALAVGEPLGRGRLAVEGDRRVRAGR